MTDFLELLFEAIVIEISRIGYWGIGIGMALESACVPIPSEIILPFGGYLASIDKLNFWGAAIAGAVGGTVGSILAYLLGLLGGRPFLQKYGRYFFIKERDLHKAEKWFHRYGEATAFFSRLLPIIRTFISLPCGLAQMKFSRFAVYSFLGSLIWSIALTYAGFKMGEHWSLIRTWFHEIDLVLGVLIIVAFLIFLVRKRLLPSLRFFRQI